MRWTVFTGDLIASSAVSVAERDAALLRISEACSEISQWSGTPNAYGFAVRGGDGWQAAFAETPFALRGALFVLASLKSSDTPTDTRIAVSKGDGALPEDGNPNRAHGPAFTDSGRLLDALPAQRRLDHAAGGAESGVFVLADHIASGWTQAQARALTGMLPPKAGPRKDTAQQLGISRQAVDQALNAAGYPAISTALAALETQEARPLVSAKGTPE